MRQLKFLVIFNICAIFCICKADKKIRKYDFIIIGGGTSGLTLARELSKNPNFQILIFEAGPGPLKNETWYNHSINDWHYKTKDDHLVWHAGKGIGGSSELGNRMYQPGDVQDYEAWGKKCPGWGYKHVKKYFLKLKKNNNQTKSSKEHLKIQEVKITTAGITFLSGMYELGYREVPNTTKNRTKIGYSRVATYFKNDQQTTSSRELFQELQQQNNVVFSTDSYVTKVKVNSTTKQANAVLFEQNGILREIAATKEIVLCAGVVGSSKILLLSGIGPRKDLEELKIDVVMDLPTGKGIKDHIGFPDLSYMTNYKTNQKKLNGTNHTNGAEAMGYISLKRDKESHRPDVEYLVFNRFLTDNFQTFTGVSEEYYTNNFKGAKVFYGMYIIPILLNPKSEGEIKLKSKNWQDASLIETNYLKEEYDLETLAESVMFIDNVLVQTQAFRKKGATLFPVTVCPEKPYKSKEYWKCAIKKIHMSMGDYMGGCRMGPRNKNSSVVDNELKIHGLKNLRVVDASVIPVTMTGHLEAAVIMVAKKAAELIRKQYV